MMLEHRGKHIKLIIKKEDVMILGEERKKTIRNALGTQLAEQLHGWFLGCWNTKHINVRMHVLILEERKKTISNALGTQLAEHISMGKYVNI
jgi:hypothetical protein